MSDFAGLAARYGLPPTVPVEVGRYALQPEVFCRRCRLTLPAGWRSHRGVCRCESSEPALMVPWRCFEQRFEKEED
jgi:hypothetical protein